MPFVKGKSGNPGGKRKGKYATDALMLELKSMGEDMPELRQIMRKTIELAKDGNVQARDCILERLEGKVPQGVIGSDDDPAIAIHHTIVRKIIEPK